jgi:heme/copper-type cytochrome/quinol oxidase subunit 2
MLEYIIWYSVTVLVVMIFCLWLYRSEHDKKKYLWLTWMISSALLSVFWPIAILAIIMMKIMGVKADEI